jgi:hypothetical protein
MGKNIHKKNIKRTITMKKPYLHFKVPYAITFMIQFGDEKITPTTLHLNYTSPSLLLFHFGQSLLEMMMDTPKSLQEVTI